MMLALRPLALEMRFVDAPGGRKRHVGVVPVMGGLAMFVAVAVGIAVLPGHADNGSMLLIGGALLVMVGIIDDRFDVSVTARLFAQLAAVLVMVFGAGMIMHDIGDPLALGTINLGPFSLLVTVLISLSVINAYNMCDGLDGLAGCLAMVPMLALAYLAGTGSDAQAVATVMCAAIIGFLVFNFPLGKLRPFRAFMGDAGSTFLGFAVVWMVAGVSQGPDRLISPVHGLWLAALPIYDFFTCVALRAKSRRSPMSSGRDHFHHVLLDSGLSVRATLFILVGLQVAYASFGIACLGWGIPEPAIFAVWAVTGLAQRKVIRVIGSTYVIYRLRRLHD